MSDVRVLVVEDNARWQELLKEILQDLCENVQIDTAPNYKAAIQAITDQVYDLVTMDLELSGDPPDPSNPDQEGMQLLRVLRDSHYKQNSCGLIVVTAFGSLAHMRQAFRDYKVDDFIDKVEFDDQKFLEIARTAVRNLRLRRAVARSNARYRLTITCAQDQLIGSELSGPDRRAVYTAARPVSFGVEDLVRRTDNLNTLLLAANGTAWRPEARSIGDAIYQTLASEQRILGDLVAARALADRFSDLWIQFSSPPIGLGLPFELLRDSDDFLGFAHILSRRLIQPGPTFSHKTEPFHAFVENLLKRGETLRVLVVGANSDGAIPDAEHEAAEIAEAIKKDLEYIGIASNVVLLRGQQASYTRVSQELSEGRYHIFHYAGHGRYSDKLPESAA